MGCTLHELLDRITSAEITEVLALYEIDGWPGDTWPPAATVAATIANCHAKDRTFKPLDFMPHHEEEQLLSYEDVKRAFAR
ncbi:MAG: hypothetical protein KatS3mg038_3161 [Candidatus Kapaibacterium sp.]|nr:MAG: hypothetical protein KatS3mg038_1938 [Candidatus Kapabacteria bacterium]GIV52640.1 MAG: hypothetical protein KatS3mg038_3161 [Candidatus Kapabacteria bacterium]